MFPLHRKGHDLWINDCNPVLLDDSIRKIHKSLELANLINKNKNIYSEKKKDAIFCELSQ